MHTAPSRAAAEAEPILLCAAGAGWEGRPGAFEKRCRASAEGPSSGDDPGDFGRTWRATNKADEHSAGSQPHLQTYRPEATEE